MMKLQGNNILIIINILWHKWKVSAVTGTHQGEYLSLTRTTSNIVHENINLSSYYSLNKWDFRAMQYFFKPNKKGLLKNTHLYTCMYFHYVKHEVMPQCDFAHVMALVILLKLYTIWLEIIFQG